ncbi:MAG: DUF3105 domain-containing protein [Dehalococcoidia bacterium]|nr:DUF3105 domain-containing protein [Dehalococcoidia bacterium]
MSSRGSQSRRSNASATPVVPRSTLRERLEPFGGLTTVTVIVAAVVFLAFIAWQARPRSVSTADLKGVEVAIAAATHTTNVAELIIPEGDPPVGGPHFPVPLRAGTYADPVQDGNVIHSLEHGMIWISYNRDLLPAAEIQKLEAIQGAHSRDVVLSPRPENTSPISVASWGRLLKLDTVNTQAINDFIEVNRDRSPEPGVR